MILGLFFSRDMSIEKWHRLGLLDREKLVYEAHLNCGTLDKVYCFTYGVKDRDFSYLVHKDFNIIPMPSIFNSKIGINFYSFFLPFIQARHIKQCHILKNDQMDGSWSAVLAKILLRKKLLIRTGFTLSVFMHQKSARLKELIAILMEKFAYFFCDYATVSSQHSKDYIIKKYHLSNKNVGVIYNYIDTDKFTVIENINKKNRLLFIGRLDSQKNLINLFYALGDVKIGLDVYGDGTLKGELVRLAAKLEIDVRFLGKIANDQMPNIMNQYTYYILPSVYEGMPKTLIEAMSCGLICIGTNTLGINEVMNNETGYLIPGTDSSDIASTIIKAVNSRDNNSIAQNARSFARHKFSLGEYVLKESDIFSYLMR